jgi:hypothetical protein
MKRVYFVLQIQTVTITKKAQATLRVPEATKLQFSCLDIYRVIKNSLCTSWLQYRMLQVMSKVFPASLQTFTDTPNCVIEDRVQDNNYVIIVTETV